MIFRGYCHHDFFRCCKLVGADLLDEKVCEKLKSFISFLKIFFSGLHFILYVCWSDLQELKQSGKYHILVFLSNKLKGTVKEKWKLITSALDRDPWKLYLMFLSREIDIQLCQIYTKTNIYTILYKSSRFNQIIFSK